MSPHALTYDKRVQKLAAYVVGDCGGILGSFPVFLPYESGHSKNATGHSFQGGCTQPQHRYSIRTAGTVSFCPVTGHFGCVCFGEKGVPMSKPISVAFTGAISVIETKIAALEKP